MDNKNKYIFATFAAVMSLSFWTFSFAQLYVPNTTNINRIVVQQQRQKMKSDLLSKINLIEDKQKKYLATKITNEMDNTHELWLDHFYSVLSDLDSIVGKIKTRSQKAASNGKDVSSVESAVAKAENSLQVAKSVLDSQAEVIYIVDVNLITKTVSLNQDLLLSTLRNQFKILSSNMEDNINSIKDGAMKDARNDVREAFLVLADVPDVDDRPADFINK